MYEGGKSLLLRLLRVPHEPHPPEGSPGSLRTFRAAPAYYKYRLLGWALANGWVLVVALAAIGGLSAGLAKSEAPPGVVTALAVLEALGFAGLLAGLVVSYLTLRLDYEMRWYMVTDRSLRIREGIWHVHEMTMTFANIQNISISQGPLQRLFGIADLRVQSAGGGGMGAAHAGKGQPGMTDLHVGFFRGVENAEAIRDLVLHRLKLLRDAGLGDHDDDHSARPPAAAAGLIEALRELKDEAALLRQAAEREGGAGR